MSEENQQQDHQQIETVSKDEFDKVVAERDDLLQFKPKKLSEEEKVIATKQQELWEKEKSLELKSVELDKFADFFNAQNVEELKDQVEKFQGLLNEVKVSLGYIPNDHQKQNEYDVFASKKDTKGMISSKFAKLFN